MVDAPAADVGHRDASREPVAQPIDQRQDVVDQESLGHVLAVLRHQGVELGVGAVGDPAALTEAGDESVLDTGHQTDQLRELGEVVLPRLPRQHGAVLGWEVPRTRERVVLDDAADQHGRQPLSDVPLLESGRVGNPL